MADRPILFSAPMVRALLDGRKTQTRRAFKARYGLGQPVDLKEHGMGAYSGLVNDPASWGYPFAEDGADMQLSRWPELSGFQRGDRLWVKETWAVASVFTDVVEVRYRASEGAGHTEYVEQVPLGRATKYVPTWPSWKPSIFMQRWASRLTLIVTDVRIERLQACSEADAIAEGLEWVAPGMWVIDRTLPIIGDDPSRVYGELWDHINGAGAWEANPWVVAVSFDVRRANIDG